MNRKMKGFTLLEVILTLVIIAIISLVAIPAYSRTKLNSEVVAHNANVRAIETAAYIYLSENKFTDKTITFEEIKPYLSNTSIKPADFTDKNDFTIEYEAKTNKITVSPGIYKIVDGKADVVKD